MEHVGSGHGTPAVFPRGCQVSGASQGSIARYSAIRWSGPEGMPAAHLEYWVENSRSYRPHTLRAELEHGRLPAARVLAIGLALTEALVHFHQHGLVHRLHF